MKNKYESEWQKARIKFLKTAPRDKDGNLITDRNEYLKSLPKCEAGLPIINHDVFDELAFEYDWEHEFIHGYLVDYGMISAWDYDEFHHITD